MENQPVLELEKEVIRTTELTNLKSILLHSKERTNTRVICKVPTSRYIKIAVEYWTMHSVYVEGYKERFLEDTDFFILTNLDENGNRYKIVRDKSIKEGKGRCKECTCGNKRWINNQTGICYYKEILNTNYTTKIK